MTGMTISEEAREKLCRVARAEVGVMEVGGNNNGPRVREYQAATWLKPAAWPWCAAFVCWVLREWTKDNAVAQILSLTTPKALKSWLCQDASAYGFEDWAKKHGIKVLGPTTNPQAGDIVTYASFSHIGIVVGPVDDKFMHTVEGNTDPDGGREGNGVYLKKRKRGLARAFIRILP